MNRFRYSYWVLNAINFFFCCTFCTGKRKGPPIKSSIPSPLGSQCSAIWAWENLETGTMILNVLFCPWIRRRFNKIPFTICLPVTLNHCNISSQWLQNWELWNAVSGLVIFKLENLLHWCSNEKLLQISCQETTQYSAQGHQVFYCPIQ